MRSHGWSSYVKTKGLDSFVASADVDVDFHPEVTH